MERTFNQYSDTSLTRKQLIATLERKIASVCRCCYSIQNIKCSLPLSSVNDYTSTVEMKGDENWTNASTKPQHLTLLCGEH